MGKDAVDRAYAAGREAHPRLALERDALERYLDERAEAWQDDQAVAADLYLACAALARVPHAVDTFVTRYLGNLRAYLGRLAKSDDFVAEVKQVLSVRLLVGDEENPPRLAEYQGRGSLEGWVRIAAQRVALNLGRATARNATFTDAVERRLVDDTDDLAHIKRAYREPFSKALAHAATHLPREHKSVLRLHYVEGMTTEQLAALYGVSRRTLVRRVSDARDALMEAVHEEVRRTIELSRGEADEMLELVRSQLEVSLASLLRKTFA